MIIQKTYLDRYVKMTCTRKKMLDIPSMINQNYVHMYKLWKTNAGYREYKVIRNMIDNGFISILVRGFVKNIQINLTNPELAYFLLSEMDVDVNQILAFVSKLEGYSESSNEYNRMIRNIQLLLDNASSKLLSLSDPPRSLNDNSFSISCHRIWNDFSYHNHDYMSRANLNKAVLFILLVSRLPRKVSIIQHVLFYYGSLDDLSIPIPIIYGAKEHLVHSFDWITSYITLLGFDAYQLLRFYPTLNESKHIWIDSNKYIANTKHAIEALTSNLITPIKELDKLPLGNYNTLYSFEIRTKLDDLNRLEKHLFSLRNIENKSNIEEYRKLGLDVVLNRCISRIFEFIDKDTKILQLGPLNLKDFEVSPSESFNMLPSVLEDITASYILGESKTRRTEQSLMRVVISEISNEEKYQLAVNYFRALGINTDQIPNSIIQESKWNLSSRNLDYNIVWQYGQILGFGIVTDNKPFNASIISIGDSLFNERNIADGIYANSTIAEKLALAKERKIIMLERTIYFIFLLQGEVDRKRLTQAVVSTFLSLFMNTYYRYGYISWIFEDPFKDRMFYEYYSDLLEKQYITAIFGLFRQNNVDMTKLFPAKYILRISNPFLPIYVNELWDVLPYGLLDLDINQPGKYICKAIVYVLGLELAMKNEGRYNSHQRMMKTIRSIVEMLILTDKTEAEITKMI